jgi:hypothetical protein
VKIKRISFIALVFLFTGIISAVNLYSQNKNTVITGKVTDANTGNGLAFVSVLLENTTSGTLTDNNGNYRIFTSATSYKIIFSYVGYEAATSVVYPGKTQEINISMKPSPLRLSEVQVKPPRRYKYSNKENPAVELIRNVIEHRDQNRIRSLDYYSYSKYEKLIFSISNLPEDFRQPRFFNKFKPLLDNVDTTRIDGKKNIPMYIREARSDCYYRKDPRAQKEIIRADKTLKLDEYIDNKGLTANIKYLYQDIDIYNNDIFFLSNKFLSPIATTSPAFYKFFIVDTSVVSGDRCIKMFFEPRNSADFLFHGFLYITTDSGFAVKKIDMSFNRKINIDWVNDVRIIQEFTKLDGQEWFLTTDEIAVDFGISQNSLGLYGQKEVWFSNYTVNKPLPDSVFRGADKIIRLYEPDEQVGYPDSMRLSPLTTSEENLYTIIDSMKNTPQFRRSMDIAMLIGTEWLTLGKYEIGPAGNFYSFNNIEGPRIRFGGRTTPQFSKRIYFDPYIAYGFKDEQFKYNLGVAYSLTGRSIYKFPVRSVKASYQYETETPGQTPEYSSKDDILMSFKRGTDDKMVYNRTFKVEYLNEFENHFSFALGYNYTRQTPGGHLYFNNSDALPLTSNVPYLNISEVNLKLRYAPKEEYYQGKLYRSPVSSRYPVFLLQSTIGSKTLNNDYDYQKLKFTVSKRFYFSIVGYTDISAEAGKIFGKVSYPLLFVHNANQTYSYQKNAYNMMNFLEFVSDEYVSLNIDHSFNGFFLNKVPVIKKFKLREVATLKMLYGGVSSLNNPAKNTDLFRFPADQAGNPSTFTLEKKPYIEASIGLSNIFRVFRVDLIKRISYLDNPHVSELGVRVQFRLDI